MPRNQRPSLLMDPTTKNMSFGEIKLAQNQWDLVNAQEEANAIQTKILNKLNNTNAKTEIIIKEQKENITDKLLLDYIEDISNIDNMTVKELKKHNKIEAEKLNLLKNKLNVLKSNIEIENTKVPKDIITIKNRIKYITSIYEEINRNKQVSSVNYHNYNIVVKILQLCLLCTSIVGLFMLLANYHTMFVIIFNLILTSIMLLFRYKSNSIYRQERIKQEIKTIYNESIIPISREYNKRNKNEKYASLVKVHLGETEYIVHEIERLFEKYKRG